MLGGLGFNLAGGRYIGHKGQMDIDDIFLAHIEPELPNRFKERQTFDITDGTADFNDDDIDILGGLYNALLDFIRNMRNDLNRAA